MNINFVILNESLAFLVPLKRVKFDLKFECI